MITNECVKMEEENTYPLWFATTILAASLAICEHIVAVTLSLGKRTTYRYPQLLNMQMNVERKKKLVLQDKKQQHLLAGFLDFS